MNILYKGLAQILSIPARLKGVKFGKNSFIGPGYDWLHVGLKGVVLGDNITIGRNAWIQTRYKSAPGEARYQATAGKARYQTVPGRVLITIGNNTQIGRHVVISAIKKITIGSNCLFGYNVSLVDHDHLLDPKLSPVESGLGKPEEIEIGDEAFIGAHSFILKGVHLGQHCVVGANSVVAKSFPAYSVIAGNPARLIRKLK